MLSFDDALRFILKWEGGFVDDPEDLGGATYKGITQRTYDHYREQNKLAHQSIKLLSQNELRSIYYGIWGEFDELHLTPALRIAVFNDAVNMGSTRAAELLLHSGHDLVKFLELQEEMYHRFALVASQHKFLRGWLNRLNDLRKLLGVPIPKA